MPNLSSYLFRSGQRSSGASTVADDNASAATEPTTSTANDTAKSKTQRGSSKSALSMASPSNGGEDEHSIHKLANKERLKRNLPPLGRSRAMDRMAQKAVDKMAKYDDHTKGLISSKKLAHSLNTSVVSRNIEIGASIRELHQKTMQKGTTSREKILSKRYEACGMATATSKKTGNMYLVQIFRGKLKRSAVV